MNKYIKVILLWAVVLFSLPASAQISRISGTVSDEFGGMGFTGAFVGMFAVDTEFYKKRADFAYFDYKGLDKL